jgi:predicted dehydrogenase
VTVAWGILPNSMHVEWTLRALEAGKHVLCEKPLSRRPADVERAFDLAEREGLVLSEGFTWRHHPQTRRLAELVAEGAIGRLQLVRASLFVDDPCSASSLPVAHPLVRDRAPPRAGAGADRVRADPVEAADSYRLELENVSAAIRDRAPRLLGREDALGQARAIEALYNAV